jgi:hypothetical protein
LVFIPTDGLTKAILAVPGAAGLGHRVAAFAEMTSRPIRLPGSAHVSIAPIRAVPNRALAENLFTREERFRLGAVSLPSLDLVVKLKLDLPTSFRDAS